MRNLKIKNRTSNNKWIIAVVLTVLFQMTIFAGNPGDFGGTDDTNPTDTPAAPIDNYVWVLMGIGIGFAFYKYRKLQAKSELL
jgi:hypothetical protein